MSISFTEEKTRTQAAGIMIPGSLHPVGVRIHFSAVGKRTLWKVYVITSRVLVYRST
jgi:hypothetical protein